MVLGEVRGDVATNDQSEELHCAAGNLKILSAEGVEAKGFDDDGCKLGMSVNYVFELS